MDPGDANALYELAEIHRQLCELDQAQQLFETALKYDPDFQEAQVGWRLRAQNGLQQGTETPGKVTRQVLENGEV